MAACGKTDAITATNRVLFTRFSDLQQCDVFAFIVADTANIDGFRWMATLGTRSMVVPPPPTRPTRIDNVNVCARCRLPS